MYIYININKRVYTNVANRVNPYLSILTSSSPRVNPPQKKQTNNSFGIETRRTT